MELPENILSAIRSSATEEEAFQKVLKIKDVPQEVANAFRAQYDPERKLTSQEAFSKLYKVLKQCAP